MQRLQQEELLRRYITEKRVSFQVGSRVYDYIKTKLKRDCQRVHEIDIVALKEMPNTLQMQLRCDVYGPMLVRHPVFHYVNVAQDGVMEEICHSSMSERTVMPGSEFFTVGTPSASMCFLVAGALDYYYKNASDAETVEEGNFICEATLWIQWLHRGRAVAPVVTELAVVCATRFRECIARNNRMLRCAQEYAQTFANHYVLRHQAREPVSDLSAVIDSEESWSMASETFGSCFPIQPNDKPRVSGLSVPAVSFSHKTISVFKRAGSPHGRHKATLS